MTVVLQLLFKFQNFQTLNLAPLLSVRQPAPSRKYSMLFSSTSPPKDGIHLYPIHLISLIWGWSDGCVCFFAVARYLIGKKLTIRLQNTPNSSPTGHISNTSRDTTLFATSTHNIVPRYINLHFPNSTHILSLTWTLFLIISTAYHSPWVATATATGGGGGSTGSGQQQAANCSRHRQWWPRASGGSSSKHGFARHYKLYELLNIHTHNISLPTATVVHLPCN